MKLTTKILLSLLLGIFVTASLQAQISIASDDLNTCDNMLNDTNETAPYGPNEDETLTICPEAPETILNLYWVSFNLGDGDIMRIYDGPDTSFPLIGQYTGQQLSFQDVTSTSPSGCLTLHWTSDDSDEGDFGAVITCGQPCDKPIVAATVSGDSSQPILACQGETFTLDASGTTFAEGASIQSALWTFDDGTTSTGWPTVQKMYTESGSYRVNLNVTDNNGCTNLNVIDVRFFVSTQPILTASANDNLVCVGQEVDLSGVVQSVPHTSAPQVDFGDGVYIPDNQGCFSDTIWMAGFANNATITSIDDIANVYVNYEHSFMSDFTISVICPDGSSLSLHSQGGGGTWLGHPCDNTTAGATGEGLDYWWSPSTTNPTWASANGQGGFTHSYNDPCSGSTGNSLNSGTYAAVGDWNNLVGCPLNGAWVISVCDIVGQDDGYIYSWGVEFAASLYPDDMSFVPTFGAGCDSTYWLGSYIVDNGVDCDNVVVVPEAPGTYNYSYIAIDNHGCVYSSVINIVAYQGPIIDAGEDFYFCGPAHAITGEVTNPQPSINYNYSWNNSGFLTNANSATPTINDDAVTETTAFVLSVYPTDDPGCLVTDTVFAIVPEYPPFAMNDTIRVCLGENGVLFAPTEEEDNYAYQWYYSDDNVSYAMIPEQTYRAYSANTQGYYRVDVTELGCGFTSPTPFWVEVFSCEIVYPNIFTPNGDGKNDMFQIAGVTEFPGSTLVVYNRWGKVVYESKDYRNNWSGDDLPEGVYYFVAEINKRSGKEKHGGYFQLVR